MITAGFLAVAVGMGASVALTRHRDRRLHRLGWAGVAANSVAAVIVTAAAVTTGVLS